MFLNYFYLNEGINFKIWQIIKIHSGLSDLIQFISGVRI